MERETGFEPATSTLARSHSTTELFPPERPKYHTDGPDSTERGAAEALCAGRRSRLIGVADGSEDVRERHHRVGLGERLGPAAIEFRLFVGGQFQYGAQFRQIGGCHYCASSHFAGERARRVRVDNRPDFALYQPLRHPQLNILLRPPAFESDYLESIRRYAQRVVLAEGQAQTANLKLVSVEQQQ